MNSGGYNAEYNVEDRQSLLQNNVRHPQRGEGALAKGTSTKESTFYVRVHKVSIYVLKQAYKIYLRLQNRDSSLWSVFLSR